MKGTFILGSLALIISSLTSSFVKAEPPHRGPYEVEFRDYRIRTLEGVLKEAVFAFPVINNSSDTSTFPFISFAHGAFTGGPQTQILHTGVLKGLASHGFIVGATKSCMVGCPDDRWDNYWDEQLKVIEFTQDPAQSDDDVLGRIDHSKGYGIAGHSMGGQATARSATRAHDYNIKAAILLHPYSTVTEDIAKDIQVPFAGFTGSLDSCCGERSTRRYYDDAVVPKTLANLKGALHTEPNMPNSAWEAYMAAFFKVWIEGDRSNYFSLIYDKNHPDNLCTYYVMSECQHANLPFKI